MQEFKTEEHTLENFGRYESELYLSKVGGWDDDSDEDDDSDDDDDDDSDEDDKDSLDDE